MICPMNIAVNICSKGEMKEKKGTKSTFSVISKIREEVKIK